ncbi:MAG: glycoside hydrolase family 15 protein, partial [Dehalococcoidia bacterium]
MAPSDYAPISDYALIGDCRSAALVSREGSIDWLCWPRFDSPSLFAAILDRDRGGRFSVRPVDPFTSTRRYLGETAILETTFQTRDGLARLTDLMPVASEREKAGALWPDHELLRRVECVEGTVEVEVVFDPRPDYGRIVPRLEHWPNVGLACEHMGRVVALRSDVPLSVDGGPGRRGRLRLSAGETRTLALTFEQGLPVVSPSSDGDVDSRIASTRAWWEAWAADGARFTGPHAEAVQRSAITLKLLSFAPSGAIVAAPTTSLPEDVGGVRNWDYRYCWLRDASLTLRALDDVGHAAEADAFLSWLLHATRLTWPELQVLYDVYGEARIPESVLGHLEGYRRSAPVRVGNAAADQLQLDVYGEVIDAAWRYVRRGGRLDRTMARTLVGFGRTVVRRWREPDEGIWEPRSGRRHHTHSKAMCWLALDRLVDLCARGHVAAEAATFARERDAIRRAIERDGVSERLGCYVSVFGSEGVDASLLLLSVMGYADPRSE